MTTVITLQELLVALYDSVDGALRFAREQAAANTGPVSIAARRAEEIFDVLGSAHILASTAFEVTEVTLRFDCELHMHQGRACLRLRRRYFWRAPASLPLEIRLYGSQPLKTDVRLGGELIKRIAGRPAAGKRDQSIF